MPDKKQISQVSGSDSPKDNHAHDRIEAITCFFLSCWVTADILVDYGHNRIAVWVFYLAILFPIALLTHHARKGWPAWAKIITWVFVFIVLVLPIFLFVVTYLASFSATVKTSVSANRLSGREGAPWFWCVHYRDKDSQNRPTNSWGEVSPVYFAFYVKFINERDSPMFVDGFSVETKTPKGNWEKMPVFDVRPEGYGGINFYYVPGTNITDPQTYFKHARKIDFGDNFLQFRFGERALNSHEPTQGWVLLDMPKDGWTENCRFTIETGGETITQPMKFLGKPGVMDIQTVKTSASFNFSFQDTDISGFPVRFYSDDTNPNTELFK